MKNCKLSWGLVVALSNIVALFAYKFTVGEVQPSEDGHQAVMLTKDERNWLQNSQAILAAASEKDFDTVIKSAKASGMAAEAKTPGSLFRKIPVEMKALGFGTRKKFDDIAADAGEFKDSNRIVSKLSVAMNNRMSCDVSFC